MNRLPMAAVGAAAVVLTACGGGSSSTSMRPDAARQLQSDVLAVTQQAAAKNWQGVRTALATLRADLDASVSAGAITPQRAAAIDAATAQIAGEIPAAVTPTPTTTKPAPPAKKPAPPATHHHGHGDGGGGDG